MVSRLDTLCSLKSKMRQEFVRLDPFWKGQNEEFTAEFDLSISRQVQTKKWNDCEGHQKKSINSIVPGAPSLAYETWDSLNPNVRNLTPQADF